MEQSGVRPSVRPSVCLSFTAAAACRGFAAERRAAGYSASEATAKWRFTNFVLYCIVYIDRRRRGVERRSTAPQPGAQQQTRAVPY